MRMAGGKQIFLNPIQADVWFTQNSREGGGPGPPPLFPYCDTNL